MASRRLQQAITGTNADTILKARVTEALLLLILIEQNYRLNLLIHVHICQMFAQLSYGDTCEIGT